MLRQLSIRDVLLIDSLDLDLQPGLNVLTGETGAGKSILLDALGFVLGWRGRADIVRQGKSEGEVSAEFELASDHPANAVLREAGLPIDDILLMRRINTRDGRKRAFVNDRRVSGDVLRALSDCLVELHGQHDDRGLLDPKGHRALLDAFGGHDADLEQVAQAWQALSRAKKVLKERQEELDRAASDADFLRHSVDELDALNPCEGEDARLDTRRRLMQAAGRIREDIEKAGAAIGADGAEGRMADAIRWLEGVADQAEGHLEDPAAALGRALAELAEAQQGIETALLAMAFDPTELEETEERLFAIRALGRKHNVLPDALPDFAADLRARLASIDTGHGDIEALKTAVADGQDAYLKSAHRLSQKRKEAAARLDKAMAGELAPLKMERAVFSTVNTTDTDALGSTGQDHVAFTVATNPGAPAGPLNKIASGGELSRFLLALKVCLSARATGLTMIFDEIDRGVGGATADAVGRRLAGVAGDAQVLVVTHSPQVAALGAHHFQVRKSVDQDMTTTSVISLDADARVEEIARMLAGDTITPEARSAAQALLQPQG